MLLNISFHFDYFPLLVIVAIAWATPNLLSLLKLTKIPSVIVEIIFGYFIGQYFLASIDHESYRILEFFALCGFIFLMFLSGLEIDVDHMLASLPRKKLTYIRFITNPLLVGIVYFFLTIILAFAFSLLLSNLINIPNIWYFSLIIVTTSVGIVLPVLKDGGGIKNRYGQMIVVAAAIADIFSIILFTFTSFIIKNGFQTELFYILGLFILFVVFYWLGSKLKNVPFIKKQTFQQLLLLIFKMMKKTCGGSIVFRILIFIHFSQYIICQLFS